MGYDCKPTQPTISVVASIHASTHMLQQRHPFVAHFMYQAKNINGSGLNISTSQLLPTAGCSEKKNKNAMIHPVRPCAR